MLVLGLGFGVTHLTISVRCGQYQVHEAGNKKISLLISLREIPVTTSWKEIDSLRSARGEESREEEGRDP